MTILSADTWQQAKDVAAVLGVPALLIAALAWARGRRQDAASAAATEAGATDTITQAAERMVGLLRAQVDLLSSRISALESEVHQLRNERAEQDAEILRLLKKLDDFDQEKR